MKTGKATEENGPATGSGNENAHLFHFTGWKAGTEMSATEKSKINQVIFEMSKDSKYFQQAQRNDEKTREKIQQFRRKIEVPRQSDLRSVTATVDRLMKDFEDSRDLSQIFCVVDMDMFFAAVEIRDRPELKNKPVAVGGMSMISTANYEARKYGVRSAMPGFIAKKLCPHLIFVKSDFAKYKKVNKVFTDIFKEYDPNLRSMSLDEAVLNITEYVEGQLLLKKAAQALKNNGSSKRHGITVKERYSMAESVVNEMRNRVYEKTKLTCSAGIGPFKTIAKIASDFNKPNGQHLVLGDRNTAMSFIRKLPIRKVPGIGKVQEKILQDAFNIHTVEEIYKNRYLVYHLLTPVTAKFLLRISMGCGSNNSGDDEDSAANKSVSLERTFREIREFSLMCEKLHDISHTLAKQLESKKMKGKTVTLKLKTSNFQVRNKQTSLKRYVGWKGEDLFNIALPLMRSLKPESLRLMGIKVSGLIDVSSADSRKVTVAIPRDNTQHFISEFLRNNRQLSENKNDITPNSSKVDLLVDTIIPCPVCAVKLDSSLGNDKINQHIDLCLNNGLLTELGKADENLPTRAKKKSKRSLRDYF
eukprot:CAMPEP_0204823230 /NCGR_PEP_ID=MMETSP1346-20131115/1310_1 /ASSEMBLY_ACC=CAM_ASM_000771 /TAXON_ID=215587 /ORGANISM="Aplanochytrium stocchinoi, Strain GSBS06" /LENGTH=586 /DNA_ID=CAMNT_0051949787 /DNA_START=615 /DNA_END=2375 /DNA_ORIENTATION=-